MKRTRKTTRNKTMFGAEAEVDAATETERQETTEASVEVVDKAMEEAMEATSITTMMEEY